MPISDQAQLMYEAAQNAVAMTALTDDGGHTFFKSLDNFWSKKSGFAPEIRPDGVINGFTATPAVTVNQIDVTAGTCYQAGVRHEIASVAGLGITRPTVQDYKISSIVIDDAQALVEVEGAEGSGFSATRGAGGGAPYIPVGQIEVLQVRMSAQGSAVFTVDEIRQTPGDTQERFNFPHWNEKRVNVENGILGKAGVEFLSALPLIHTGDTPKKVYAKYFTPEFAELRDATDFVPAEVTHTTTSTQVYGRTLGGSSQTLNQATFTFYPEDGITDSVFKEKNENLLFKFKQDKLNDPFLIMQGVFGISRTFPSGDLIATSATISAESAAAEVTTV